MKDSSSCTCLTTCKPSPGMLWWELEGMSPGARGWRGAGGSMLAALAAFCTGSAWGWLLASQGRDGSTWQSWAASSTEDATASGSNILHIATVHQQQQENASKACSQVSSLLRMLYVFCCRGLFAGSLHLLGCCSALLLRLLLSLCSCCCSCLLSTQRLQLLLCCKATLHDIRWQLQGDICTVILFTDHYS